MNLTMSESNPSMATVTLTSTEGAKPLQTKDIATRLLNGTLHSQWPAFEQFKTIDGLLKSHAAQPDEGKHPLICYPIRGAADFEEHTASDIDRYTDVAVRFYMQQGLTAAVRLSCDGFSKHLLNFTRTRVSSKHPSLPRWLDQALRLL
jgi:hypothetical protein